MRRLREWASRLLLTVNAAMFVVLAWLLVGRGARFSQPWDGPAVVTVALTVATLVLAAVGLGVALIAVWGYNALREHAGNVARETSAKIADETATRTVQAWIDRSGIPPQEDLSGAYKGKEGEP